MELHVDVFCDIPAFVLQLTVTSDLLGDAMDKAGAQLVYVLLLHREVCVVDV